MSSKEIHRIMIFFVQKLRKLIWKSEIKNKKRMKYSEYVRQSLILLQKREKESFSKNKITSPNKVRENIAESQAEKNKMK